MFYETTDRPVPIRCFISWCGLMRIEWVGGRRVDHHVLVVADKCPSFPPPSPVPSLCGCSCLSPSIDLRLARHNVYGPETMMITNIHHLLTARDINLIWLDIGRNKPKYSSCGTSRLFRRGVAGGFNFQIDQDKNFPLHYLCCHCHTHWVDELGPFPMVIEILLLLLLRKQEMHLERDRTARIRA